MIQVKINTNTERKTVVVEPTQTPADVMRANGYNVSGSMLNLNGVVLNSTTMYDTFTNLGVADGATANLSAVTKGDGARA